MIFHKHCVHKHAVGKMSKFSVFDSSFVWEWSKGGIYFQMKIRSLGVFLIWNSIMQWRTGWTVWRLEKKVVLVFSGESGALYLCSKHKTLGYHGILMKTSSLHLTQNPDPTPRSVSTHLCMCTGCLRLTPSSTSLALGKEDKTGKQ